METNFRASFEEERKKVEVWFTLLRDKICEELEELERLCLISPEISPQRFQRKEWKRDGGGGGIISLMKKGRVFEKAGVNISTVYGEFSEAFRKEIPGADKDPKFWASGISLVIHPRNPHVPIVHMNTRMIITTQLWFGGGVDLTPVFPSQKDTVDFHRVLQETCDHYDLESYLKFKKWCDDYFFITHRNEPRGVGGIFYDYINSGNFEKDFEFTKNVGEAFLKIYPQIVKRYFNTPWSEEDVQHQLKKRGRYVEFNLVYDRGTKFGLQTGGNIDAILMSLPPMASWEIEA
ncbi:MAG: coproporphyrinogen III oxidase [Alphaproteobacteria bacterium 16-39-46]|nr:MAG: coproporphyrinogen III oxidase [Alphaproteobacteria bacterium 16-39-46]HQS84948.1 oxygen-dependent coproporphyrinogen oxidase [Alphaproteobacteria bacterium]HQS94717.1 oxygen-dependent coproporphyrinogen oxidase [Alphaproteobacteria bacterium]